ncbi:hypothetical protein ACH4GK_19360 [Streptomyces rimosus]|uniref:hypothetical protein n=1 Tax=Streptomyces rimosus TaxID=1927 RepID=UPI0004C79931|nr:hypothetical protein [Streptomyces rimosus]
MIRIVTAARLAALHAEVDDANDLARQAREDVAEQWTARLAASRELIEERKALTGVAHTAIVQAEEARRQAVQLRQAFTAALLVITRQQQRICELEQQLTTARAAPPRLVLLRKYGEPHSLHVSQEAAEKHATTFGAASSGWGPSSDRPAAEVAWRTQAVPVVPEQERAPRSDAE